MAIATGRWRVAERYARRMALYALQSQMRSCESEIGPAMIEYARLQIDDVCVTAFVVRMAGRAFVLARGAETAVETVAVFTIGSDLFVAADAQRSRCAVGRRIVATLAVTLEFGVAFDDPPRHKQLFEAAGGCRRRKHREHDQNEYLGRSASRRLNCCAHHIE